MGMVFADYVADDPRRFFIGASGKKPQFIHCVQYPPLDGFKTVARVGQSPVLNDKLRIAAETLADDNIEIFLDNFLFDIFFYRFRYFSFPGRLLIH